MSDRNPIAEVLDVFPQVTEAAEKYKIAVPDRESRGLARGIAVERTLFDQTAQKLLLFSRSSSSHDDNGWAQQLEAKLGAETAPGIIHDLQTLAEQLHTLKAELINSGRGKEVLDKIRVKVPGSLNRREKKSRTRLQVQLDGVSKTNQRLTSRLLYGQTILSRAFQALNTSSICQQLDDISQRAAATFNLLQNQPTCRCRGPHVVYLQCPEVVVSPGSEQLAATGGAQLLKLIFQPNEETPTHEAVCSFKGLAGEQNTGSVLPLQDWIRLQGSDLDHRSRMELALQLSVAVIQLYSTPWVDGPWTWDNWAIAVNQSSPGSGGPLLFRRQFGSSSAPSKTEPQSSSLWFILSREPVLAKLGLCLIELAFGQSLFEIRRESAGKNGVGHETEGDEFDTDSLDFMTAQQLLASQRIRYQFGEPFEDAVRACVRQQFRTGKSDDIVQLHQGDRLFLQNAAHSIISPLQSQVDRYLRAERRDAVPVKETRPKIPIESLQARQDDPIPLDRKVIVRPSTPSIQAQDKPESLTEDPGSCDAQLSSSKISQSYRAVQARLRTDHELSPSEPTLYRKPPAQSCCGAGNPATLLPHAVPQRIRGRGQDVDAGPGSKRRIIRPPSLSDESQEDSEWGYGSMTETTDSANAWAADALDESPEATDHPVLSRMTPLILRVVLRGFHAWRERTPGSAHGTAGSSAPQQSGSGKKRARGQSGRGDVPKEKKDDEDGDDNDEADDDEIEGAVGRKRQRADVGKLTLACPFFKKDCQRYGECCGKKLTRIRDVKQHLSRRHELPIYCSVCYQTFSDETKRDDHTAERSCNRGSIPRPEGVTNKQQKDLSKRPPKGLSEEQQWYSIFELLFPNEPLPRSVYIDVKLATNAMAYHDYFMSQGIEIIRKVLDESGAVQWNVPFGQELGSFQRQILGLGLATISNQFNLERGETAFGGGLATAESPRTGAAASSEGPSVEVVTAGSESHHYQTMMDTDAASSSSALHGDALSSIDSSSPYAHSRSENWSALDEHQHDPFPEINLADFLAAEDMNELRRMARDTGLNVSSDASIWQHRSYGQDYMGN